MSGRMPSRISELIANGTESDVAPLKRQEWRMKVMKRGGTEAMMNFFGCIECSDRIIICWTIWKCILFEIPLLQIHWDEA